MLSCQSRYAGLPIILCRVADHTMPSCRLCYARLPFSLCQVADLPFYRPLRLHPFISISESCKNIAKHSYRPTFAVKNKAKRPLKEQKVVKFYLSAQSVQQVLKKVLYKSRHTLIIYKTRCHNGAQMILFRLPKLDNQKNFTKFTRCVCSASVIFVIAIKSGSQQLLWRYATGCRRDFCAVLRLHHGCEFLVPICGMHHGCDFCANMRMHHSHDFLLRYKYAPRL